MFTLVIHIKNIAEFERTGWHVIRIDRQTKFGNPFVMRDASDQERERVIAQYAERFNADTTLQDALIQACGDHQRIAFACWCAPKACHGDVFTAFIKSRRNSPIAEIAKAG